MSKLSLGDWMEIAFDRLKALMSNSQELSSRVRRTVVCL